MRALDRLISFIFSVIMLVVSIVLILVGIGVVDSQMIIDMLNEYVFVEDMIASNAFNALTITGIVLFLAALKTTIFLSLFKIKDKSPILVKTPNGEVEIAQETITSTVRNVALSFDNIKDVQAKMVKKKKGVVIYAMVLVYANSNIRETTEEMQRQVKEVVNATTGVNVIEVNIKVKNIYQKQKKSEDNRVVTKQEVNNEKNEEIVVEQSEKDLLNELSVEENVVGENVDASNELEQIAINDEEVVVEEKEENK